MKHPLTRFAFIPLLLTCIALTGCEDDDEPSGTATVTGNVRQFYSPNEITSARAKAVGGVTVELKLVSGGYSKNTASAADGSFRFENVPAGDFELILRGGGLTGRLSFTVTEGSTVALVDIVVKPDGTTREGAIVKSDPVEETPETTTAALPAAPKVQWLDQQQAVTSGGQAQLNTASHVGQVFTVGATNGAAIFKVEVALSVFGAPVADITVTVQSAPGGDPNAGAPLGAATITGGSVGAGLEAATFATPVAVTAGGQYAILFTTTAAVGNDYRLEFTDTNPYPGGAIWSNAGAPPWTQSAGNDAIFNVWLEK